MKIAIISSPIQSTPPNVYSPKEKIISYITEGLVSRGHDVTLYATGCSNTKAKLVNFFSKPISTFEGSKEIHFAEAYNHAFNNNFDIINNNAWHFAGVSNYSKVPFITTIHNDLNFVDYNKRSLKLYKNSNYVAISKTQNDFLNTCGINIIKQISYSIDINEYKGFTSNKGDYMVVVGDICYENGIHLAIEIAKKTGIPLKIAGSTCKWIYKDYFDSMIKPELRKNNIEYLGVLKLKELKNLLSNAYLLLHTTLIDKSFPYIILESMAAGTPVISIKQSNIDKVIEEGTTGYILNTIKDILNVIPKVDSLNSNKIKTYVKENFNKESMINLYEQLFVNIINKKKGLQIK